MSDIPAPEHVRSYVDRILRLKEEQDSIGDDIKDIYAEAKGNGFDKTALGKLVAEIRARLKRGDKVDEDEAILDLYRQAYQSASHAHAREAA